MSKRVNTVVTVLTASHVLGKKGSFIEVNTVGLCREQTRHSPTQPDGVLCSPTGSFCAAAPERLKSKRNMWFPYQDRRQKRGAEWQERSDEVLESGASEKRDINSGAG